MTAMGWGGGGDNERKGKRKREELFCGKGSFFSEGDCFVSLSKYHIV